MAPERGMNEAILNRNRVKVQIADLNVVLLKHLIGRTIPGQIIPFAGVSPGARIVDEEKIRSVLSDLSFKPFADHIKSKLPREWNTLRDVAKTHPVVILTSSGLIFARNSEKEWRIKHGLDNKLIRLFRKPRVYLTELMPMPISK